MAERPLGFWLKRLGGLIEVAAGCSYAEEGLARRHWQVRNVIEAGPVSEAGLRAALRPFWTEGAVTLGEVTGEMTSRGWLTRDDEGHPQLPGVAAQRPGLIGGAG